MVKRDNVYAHADEQFVKTLIVHANESNELFYDEALENPVTTDELQDLFLKGLTVVEGTGYFKAVSYDSETNAVTCYNGTEAVIFTATEAATE